MSVNFEIDGAAILAIVLAGHEGHNDMGVIIQNGTDRTLSIDWQVLAGSIDQIKGDLTVPPVADTANAEASLFALGVAAQGRGSEIFLYIQSVATNETWGFIASAEPTKLNYTKGLYFNTPITKEACQKAVDDIKSNTSEGGPWTLSGGGVEVTTTITGTSPVETLLQFAQS